VELTIAILVFRYSPVKLVQEILEQCRRLEINFEVLIYDDGSEVVWQEQLKGDMSSFPEVFLELGAENKGRAAGRNFLGRKALGEYILMMDGDSQIDSPHFVNDFFRVRKANTTVIGGLITSEKPLPGAELRWKYAQEREIQSLDQRKVDPYAHFKTGCFFIDRRVFEKVQFAEALRTYGYEDNLFGFELKKAGVSVLHIQNPMFHAADDRSLAFLAKSEEAMESLLWIDEHRPDWATKFKLLRLRASLRKWKLSKVVFSLLNLMESSIRSSLEGPSPSLWRFDLFRLHRLLLLDFQD